MSDSIRLSPKHGVNPALMYCPLCGGDTNGLALLGRLPNDAEAPRYVEDTEPCAECREYMKAGIVLVEASPTGGRTGRLCVVREEAVRRFITPEKLLAHVLAKRAAFVYPDAYEKIGLGSIPHEAEKGAER